MSSSSDCHSFYTTPQEQPYYNDPLTTVRGLCSHYNLDICRITNTPFNYICDYCEPVAAPINGFPIFEPTILLVCLVAGITGIISGIRIYKNREAKGHFEYSITFIGFGVCMVLTMLTRCIFAPDKDTGAETGAKVALVAVLVALSCCVGLSLIFDGLVDVAVIRDGCWLCIVIMGVSYVISFGVIIGLTTAASNAPADSTHYANTLQFFTYFLPLFGVCAYFVLELINVLRRGSKFGGLWLFIAAILFLLGCLCLTVLNEKLLCKYAKPFDGVFFYYLFLDLAFTVLYKFFVTIKEEELDDDEPPMLCLC